MNLLNIKQTAIKLLVMLASLAIAYGLGWSRKKVEATLTKTEQVDTKTKAVSTEQVKAKYLAKKVTTIKENTKDGTKDTTISEEVETQAATSKETEVYQESNYRTVQTVSKTAPLSMNRVDFNKTFLPGKNYGVIGADTTLGYSRRLFNSPVWLNSSIQLDNKNKLKKQLTIGVGVEF